MIAGRETHTSYHPRWHRRRMSVWWWLGRWRYARFVLRELTSLLVAAFAGITLWQISALSSGAERYEAFLRRMQSAPFVALNAVALVAVVFHAVTWFNLAPLALPVRFKGRRVPDAIVAGAHYAAWIVVSAAVAWILLGG